MRAKSENDFDRWGPSTRFLVGHRFTTSHILQGNPSG
jgi:hypothetical protein